MRVETIISELKHELWCMPKEPPKDCDYPEEWLNVNKNIREAKESAIEILEKQIPKKPRFYNCNYYCPICDDLVGCHDTIMKWDNKFCKHCGQAIKWE